MGVWCASANVGAPPRHCSVSDKNIITLDRYNFVCRPGFLFATLPFRSQTRLSLTRMPGRQL